MNLPNPKKTVILLPSMGNGYMPETQKVADALKKLRVTPLVQDIRDEYDFSLVRWPEVDLVDCSHMRGCLPDYTKYDGILGKIKYANPDIKIIPGAQEREWIASKSSYLKELEARGIRTIPTCHLSMGESQDNLDECVNNALSYIKNSNSEKFVLKPSVSALAVGLNFIEAKEDGSFDVTIPAKGNEESEVQKYANEEQFVTYYLKNYLRNRVSADHNFLLQEFVENIETSAVFINGTPHFIKRTTGDKKIAHGQFGGEDILVKNPDQGLVDFVKSVVDVLPEEIQKSPYLRIDIMQLADGTYCLAEIEGAGAARLFLDIAGRVDEYAKMLVDIANGNFDPAIMATEVLAYDRDNVAVNDRGYSYGEGERLAL